MTWTPVGRLGVRRLVGLRLRSRRCGRGDERQPEFPIFVFVPSRAPSDVVMILQTRIWSLTIFRESSLQPTSRFAEPRRHGAEIHIVGRDDIGHRQAARVSIKRPSGVAAEGSRPTWAKWSCAQRISTMYKSGSLW